MRDRGEEPERCGLDPTVARDATANSSIVRLTAWLSGRQLVRASVIMRGEWGFFIVNKEIIFDVTALQPWVIVIAFLRFENKSLSFGKTPYIYSVGDRVCDRGG